LRTIFSLPAEVLLLIQMLCELRSLNSPTEPLFFKSSPLARSFIPFLSSSRTLTRLGQNLFFHSCKAGFCGSFPAALQSNPNVLESTVWFEDRLRVTRGTRAFLPPSVQGRSDLSHFRFFRCDSDYDLLRTASSPTIRPDRLHDLLSLEGCPSSASVSLFPIYFFMVSLLALSSVFFSRCNFSFLEVGGKNPLLPPLLNVAGWMLFPVLPPGLLAQHALVRFFPVSRRFYCTPRKEMSFPLFSS